MVIGAYISIIILNVNGLNAPTKRHRLAEWIQRQDLRDFPGGTVVKNSPPKAGDAVQSLVRELDPTCMLQLRVCMPQLRSPLAATKESTSHN